MDFEGVKARQDATTTEEYRKNMLAGFALSGVILVVTFGLGRLSKRRYKY